MMHHYHVSDLIERLGSTNPKWGLHMYSDRSDDANFVGYPTLRAYVLNAADRYFQGGVRPGTRVILPFETSIETIVAFLALIELGALPFCVKPAGAGSQLSSYVDFLRRVSHTHRVDYLLATSSVRDVPPSFKRLPLPALDATPVARASRRHSAPEEIAFVQFSSGSTSFPKGVPITHEKLMRQLDLLVAFDRRVAGDAGATWLPLFHDMGLIGGLLSSIHSRLDLHLWSPRRFLGDPLGFVEMVSKRRVAVFGTPNFALEYVLRSLKSADDDVLAEACFDGLRHVFVGAEPINPSALFELAGVLGRQGLKRAALQPSYGMAEAVLMATGGRDAPPRIVKAPNGVPCISVGKPLTGFEVALHGVNGLTANEGEVGEILLRGGTLAKSYFEHSTALLDENGFYRTGDIGFLDAGELFVLGRTGDRLKINGESYFAHDFERVVESVESVRARTAVVLQVNSDVVVLVERPKTLDHEILRNHITAAIQNELGIKVARTNVIAMAPGQIRRTSSGKIRRSVMVQEYEEGRLRTLLEPSQSPSRQSGAEVFLG